MKSSKEKPATKRRKFDETFKREAVNNWITSGKAAEVIAQELGLRANRLYAWKKHFAPADCVEPTAWAKPGSVGDLQGQLESLRRENRHLREQRDILKKTLGILSEPSLNVSNG